MAVTHEVPGDLDTVVWPIAEEVVCVLSSHRAVCDSRGRGSIDSFGVQCLFNLDGDGVVLLLSDPLDRAVAPRALFIAVGTLCLDLVLAFVEVCNQLVPRRRCSILVQVPPF